MVGRRRAQAGDGSDGDSSIQSAAVEAESQAAGAVGPVLHSPPRGRSRLPRGQGAGVSTAEVADIDNIPGQFASQVLGAAPFPASQNEPVASGSRTAHGALSSNSRSDSADTIRIPEETSSQQIMNSVNQVVQQQLQQQQQAFQNQLNLQQQALQTQFQQQQQTIMAQMQQQQQAMQQALHQTMQQTLQAQMQQQQQALQAQFQNFQNAQGGDQMRRQIQDLQQQMRQVNQNQAQANQAVLNQANNAAPQRANRNVVNAPPPQPQQQNAFAPQGAMHPPPPINPLNANNAFQVPPLNPPQGPTSNHHLKHVELPKYSGPHDIKTPYDFLLELDKYMSFTRNTPDTMLREILPLALTDHAYHWYRHEISMAPFQNWEDFKSRFRKEFQPLGYVDELNRELELRTQGPTEPLTVFIRVILDYYERLGSRASEEEKISRIMRQMHPEYLQVLQGKRFLTIIELKEAAFQAQEVIKAYRMYRPPPIANSVEPSLAWRPVERLKDIVPEPRSNTSTFDPLKPATPLHFVSVDPFTYYHNTAPKKQVSFKDTEIKQSANKPTAPPGSPTRASSNSSIQDNRAINRTPPPSRSDSPVRERRNSGGSDGSRQEVVCYNCNEPGHYKRDCPKLQNSGNESAPSSPRRK